MKNWEHRERARATLAREVGYVQKPHGGRLRVALAFPNTYHVGMSSLGFQTVYRLFNDLDDVVCERVFLPGRQELREQMESGQPLLTIESQTPVRDFDVFALSVSFEWDYTNVVSMLRLARIAPRATDRSGARSADRDRRGRDLRQPGTAGAVRRCDCRRRRGNADPGAGVRDPRNGIAKRVCTPGSARAVGSMCRRCTTCATTRTAPSRHSTSRLARRRQRW